MRLNRLSFSAFALFLFTAILAPGLQAQVSLTTLGTPYTQSFDTLPTAGSATFTNNSTIPGWYHARTGTGTTIVANDGSSNAGNLYSYGTGTATDRALGSLGSGNAAIGNLFWGVRLQNNTGSTITSLDVSYTGEQWRNSAAAAQTVAFSYLVGSPTVTGSLAEFQSAGVAVPSLDFTSPITGGVAGALNGNLAANRVARTFSITGLSIPSGTEVMLRWSDPDHTGSDHGLSIDDFSVTPQAVVATNADLAVTKSDSPDPVNAGTNLTYTITVTNNGPDPATTATLNDTLPAGTTFVSLPAVAGWSCTTPAVGAGGTVSCSNPSFAMGSAIFTLTVLVDPTVANGTILSNSATAGSATTDPGPGINTGTTTTTVAASADLLLSKTDTPDPVNAGANITYQMTLTNNGPSNAASTSFSDALPAGTTFVSLSTTGPWSCTTPAVGAGGTVSCTNASFGVTVDFFTIVVAVDPSVAAGTVLSNTATLSSATGDPNTGNESGTATTTVAASADLSISKTDSPDPVNAGANLTYQLTLTNNGPSNAASASFSDTLPAGTTFVSLSTTGPWSCTTPAVGASGTVSCTNASFNVTVDFFTIVVAVDPSTAAGTMLSNTATLSSATTDPNPGNESATATTTVAASADLSVTKTDTPDPVTAGANLTYTITLNNAGPSDAAGVSLSDTVPAGTTFVSLASPGGWSCTTPAVGGTGLISCSIATLTAGNAVFTLIVNVGPAVAAGTMITNTATASATTADPNTGNESGTATTTVGTASADLSVTKVDTPDPVTAGANLTYTITVNNAGPSDAATVSLSDTLPAGTTFVSLASPGGWSCTTPAVGGSGLISCSIATLAAGNAVFTLVVAVDPAVASGTMISNTATATSATTDPNPGNESGTATTTVAASADLSVTKVDTPDPVTAGTNLTYTITVNNAGPSSAAGVSLSDTLPGTTTFVSLSSPGGWSCTTPAVGSGGTVTCSIASLAAGNAVFTLIVGVPAGTPSGTLLTNTATVSSTTGDPNVGNESGTATTTVMVAGAKVTGTKTAAGAFTPGSVVTYTVVLSNTGGMQNDNPGNEFTDVLPAGLTLVGASASSGTVVATVATNTVTWNGSIPASGSVTITFQATINVNVAPGTVITNQGTFAFDADGNGTNEASGTTDDPSMQGSADPTAFTVAAAAAVAGVPALDGFGLALLAMLLAAVGFVLTRKS